jgi:O-antigen/teichoic acid export membrane protein
VLFRRFVRFTARYDAGFAKFILKESYPIAVFAVLLTLVLRVDVFVLQWLKGARDVAIFEVPNRLISQVQIFATSLSVSLFPALSRSAAMGEGGKLEDYYRNAFKLLFLAGAFLAGAMVSGGAPMISLLVGREFAQSGFALKILAPSALFLFLTSLQSLLLTAMGRQAVNMGSVAVVLVLNAALDLLLVPRYSYVGASVATLVAYFALVAINSYFIRRHGLVLNLRREMAGISLGAALMCLTTFINAGGDAATVAVRLAAGTAVFAAGVFATKAVTAEEIRFLREVLTSRRKRRSGPGGDMP